MNTPLLVRRAYPLRAVHKKYRHHVAATVGAFVRLELYANRKAMRAAIRKDGVTVGHNCVGLCRAGPGRAAATVYVHAGLIGKGDK